MAQSLGWKAALVSSVSLVLTSAASWAQCTQAGSISQWRCWEQPITSSVNFYNGGTGNPYRDLTLRVTFTNSSTGASFTQDAFWAADINNPKSFKVRAALPAGTWTWTVAGCTGSTGGRSCASGVTWTPASGTINVTSSTSGPQIYARGFPAQLQFFTGNGDHGYSPVYYGDYVTPFFWAADTAWSGPGKEASGQTSFWGSYIADRQSKQFDGVLVAPASFAPASNVFVTASGCTDPVPNACSRPSPAYWQSFDNLISTANQSDIVPLIAGLIDPLDNATSGSYPRQQNAVAFARFLAARMAGFAVLYSPGFDDKPSATTADSPPVQVQQVMNAVGQAVQQAAPNYLLTNHLSGNSTCTDYESFRSSGWMTFFLFQSGHAQNPSGIAGTSCPGYLSTETSVNAAMRRTWQIPWTLRTSGAQPKMPSYNGEGPYDNPDNDCIQTPGCASYDPSYASRVLDIRYHDRQAAYMSSLSGAYGFTYGVAQIGTWTNPLSYTNRPSANDIGNVYTLFRTRAGITPHPEWIANQAPDPNNDDKKIALASDSSTLVLAYTPVDTTNNSIQIGTSSLPGLGCSGWSFTWNHAQNLAPDPNTITCTGTNPIIVSKPPTGSCSSFQDCDWVLQIQKTSTASSMAQLANSNQRLDVWVDLSPSDGTSAIYVKRAGAGLAGAEAPILVVSPSGLAFQQSPRVSHLPSGYLVVWHADGLDGSLLGIFAQRVDNNGRPLGPRLQVNTTTEEDQRDPDLDSDALGKTVVVWSSYGQDGDAGGIYGRLLDPAGQPVTPEFQVNTVTIGHQERPQVTALPGGAFVVAWQTRPIRTAPGALSFRVFSSGGLPLTNEIRILGQPGIASRLIDLTATPTGGLQVRWGLVGLDGASLGLFKQTFDTKGQPVGQAVSLP